MINLTINSLKKNRGMTLIALVEDELGRAVPEYYFGVRDNNYKAYKQELEADGVVGFIREKQDVFRGGGSLFSKRNYLGNYD